MAFWSPRKIFIFRNMNIEIIYHLDIKFCQRQINIWFALNFERNAVIVTAMICSHHEKTKELLMQLNVNTPSMFLVWNIELNGSIIIFFIVSLFHCHNIVVLLLPVCTVECSVQSWAFMAAILPVLLTDRQTRELIRWKCQLVTETSWWWGTNCDLSQYIKKLTIILINQQSIYNNLRHFPFIILVLYIFSRILFYCKWLRSCRVYWSCFTYEDDILNYIDNNRSREMNSFMR